MRYSHVRATTLSRVLGPNHRKTLDARFQASFFIIDPARAEADLADVCALYQRFHAEVTAVTIGNCEFELGWLAEARGDRATATHAMQQVPDVPGSGSVASMAHVYLLALADKPDDAIAAARSLADGLREQSWTRFNAADAYRFIAELERTLGRRDAAIADARAAIALFDQLPHLAHFAHFQRRVARARAVLTGYSR